MRFIYLFLLISVMSSHALARTWIVVKDGTGDYTVIQDAVDAATAGDTISIGPGRFIETTLYPVPSGEWTPHNYVVIDEKALTLIGSGVDVTIIGPEEASYTTDQDPFGISVWTDISSVTIENLTVENVARGVVVSHKDIVIRNSSFNGCKMAVNIWVFDGGEISDCEFRDNDMGLLVMTCDRHLEISRLNMVNNNLGISIQYSDSVYVNNCEVVQSRVCIQYTTGSSGVVSGCRCLQTVNFGISVSQAASLNVVDCRVEGCEYFQIDCTSCMDLIVADSIFTGASLATVRIGNGNVMMTGNHILNGGGLTIRTDGYLNPPDITLDFTGNYWGTTEPDTITDWIHDANDDYGCHAYIDFEPFSAVPLPTDIKSFGDIKRMFR